MFSPMQPMPKLQGAVRYSTKRDRFVFGVIDHELFVAVAVNPRICNDWSPDQRLSYGECQSLISLRRNEIEGLMRALIGSGSSGYGGRLDLWEQAETTDAF
ncbi:MAG: hypothetical protein ABWY00_11600 [Dongiaceae bacterium]